MAATVKRKPKKGTTKRKGPRAAAKPSANGKKKAAATTALKESGTEDDPNQKYLKDFEPERDSDIEAQMEPWIEAAKQRDAADDKITECRTQTTGMLRDKGLSSYRYKGYTAKFKPGDDTVQLAKPKKK